MVTCTHGTETSNHGLMCSAPSWAGVYDSLDRGVGFVVVVGIGRQAAVERGVEADGDHMALRSSRKALLQKNKNKK